MKKMIYLSFVLAMITTFPLTGTEPAGTINGKVKEYLRNRIIPGVYVQVVNTTFSTLTNEKGEFKISNVPVGSYNVKFSVDGFKPVVKADVIVRPKRITHLTIEMQDQLPL